MSKKSKKNNIAETKDYFSPYDFEGELADLRAKIDVWIAEYGEKARVDWDPNFCYSYENSPSARYNIIVDREETDDEYKARLAQEKKWQDDRDARDRTELERLQKKFGEK